MRRHLLMVLVLGFGFAEVCAASKHSAASRFMSYEGRVMCGYQGWFRAAGDGSGRSWVHYGRRGRFDPENLTIDLWPDRPYDIRKIGFERLLEFLKNDPEYGGCSVMLGVPTYFRELKRDAVNDPYLHEIMHKADIILPWMVGRFRTRSTQQMKRYGDQVRADIDWCAERGLDYVPCVYPGFSWHNLRQGREPLGAIPRHQGRFYWDLIHTAIQAEARMLYVAMFDEIDEGTAIMKCSNTPPRGANTNFLDYEGMPADHYLWLTGQGGKMLRGDMPPRDTMPIRQDPSF